MSGRRDCTGLAGTNHRPAQIYSKSQLVTGALVSSAPASGPTPHPTLALDQGGHVQHSWQQITVSHSFSLFSERASELEPPGLVGSGVTSTFQAAMPGELKCLEL